ncbi:nucleotidyltransferase family protein (plasmid) [Thalassobaculum sp. OXR-137]|uniref:nucleotidyltransferase domain-containing protein n=1 Tax=Thalassobaculum sp. OXR-137 TaxID=3100173 RepID=UPI002AC9CBB2|nr:nucleotidyltransferase family protein [Thalassobaculum sp. OXR-137]WPZ37246.1 nucleotidyltransferase family protein [Thalassobaculum sp. OXR-137]
MELKAQLPPEIRLLLDVLAAGYGTPLPPPAPTIDWDGLLQCVRHHRLAPMMKPLLRQPAHVPGPVLTRLESLWRKVAMQTLTTNAEVVRVTAALEAAGIEVLVLKGPALAVLLHGDPSRRSMRDIDLLVRPGAAEAARAVLADCGYGQRPEMIETHYNAVELRHPSRPLPIELHVHLADSEAILPTSVLLPFETATDVTIGGRTVRTLGPEAATTFAAFHGGKHLWARLFWLADFAAASRSPAVDWAAVTDLSGRLGILPQLEVGFLLLDRLLGMARPEGAPAPGTAGRVAGRVVAAIPEILTVPPMGDHQAVLRRIGPLRALGWELALQRHWRSRWATLRSRLLPTETDRGLVALPARMDFLYYGVRAARVAFGAVRRGWTNGLKLGRRR